MPDPQGDYKLPIDQIQKFLPHKAPFLLVDRILEIQLTHPVSDENPASKVGIKVVGIKNVSFNEPHFQGHFPGFSIMPGVLVLEVMAQVASFSVYPYLENELETIPGRFQCILVGVDGVRFRRPVTPGDTLRIESTVTKCRGKLWAFSCKGFVDGQVVAEAELMANMVTLDKESA